MPDKPDKKPPRRTPRAILVTGGAGFIGSNLTRYLLEADSRLRVVVFDALTYAGNLANLDGLQQEHPSRYAFIQGDICEAEQVAAALSEHKIDTIVHLAAESQVDRSIDDPLSFVQTNMLGTGVLLEEARRYWKQREDVLFHHVSTDEVFGSLDEGCFTEETSYNPSSPYSASKAGSDHLVRAWHRTYGLPVTLSSCSNNYGPYQFPEKLIPLTLMKALAGAPLPVFGDGRHVRDWLYVEDHCRAIHLILRRGELGESYNIGGDNERQNVEIVRRLCEILEAFRPRGEGAYQDLITFVTDRPAHDKRYAVDTAKIQGRLGWRPEEDMASGLRKTVAWYLDHQAWIKEIQERTDAGQRLGLGAPLRATTPGR